MSQALGRKGEERAVEYLLAQGFKIIARNVHTRYGEIDIVAQKGERLHFIEVKYSQKENPIYRITPKKLAKIYQSIDIFLAQHPNNASYSVDALAIMGKKIEFIENISILS